MNTWRIKAHHLHATHARQLADILLDTNPNDLLERHTYIATAGGDERKLRGIPAIGRGVPGHIHGTSPHAIR